MECLECNKETINPRFCNNSCAAKYNNRNRNFNPREDRRLKIQNAINVNWENG